MMGESSKSLPPFPSTSDAFKEFQRNSLPPNVPRFQPEMGEWDEGQTHVIRCHSNLLALPGRTRQRIKADTPKKKKKAARKRQDGVSSEGEEEGARSWVGSGARGTQSVGARRRSTRAATRRGLVENLSMGDDADKMELSDDEDFM